MLDGLGVKDGLRNEIYVGQLLAGFRMRQKEHMEFLDGP